MEPEVLSPAAPEGLAPQEGASQETPTTTQVAQEPQPGTTREVEPGAQPTREGEPRPFERVFGRKLDKLEKAIRSLAEAQARGTAQPGSPPTPKQRYVPTQEEWKDPGTVFQRMLDDRDQALMEKLPQAFEQRDRAASFQRSQQEALKLIETNETIKRDPEGIERMQDILEDEKFGLNQMANHFPVEAARAALEIYNARFAKGKASQSAPSKAQMQSTATGQTAGAGRMTTGDEIQGLYKQLEAMPELMKDAQFMAKVDALLKKSEIESRVK